MSDQDQDQAGAAAPDVERLRQRAADVRAWRLDERSGYDSAIALLCDVEHDLEIAADALSAALAREAELRGAMAAQDEREAKAGALCGVPLELHGCDWPDAVAETVVALRAENERLRAALKAARVWVILGQARDPETTHPKAIQNAKDDLAQLDAALAAVELPPQT